MSTTLKPAGASNFFAGGGSGSYSPLRKINKEANNFKFMDSKPALSDDMVYVVFQHIDNQPISQLAIEFVQENITTPIIQLISTISRQFYINYIDKNS